MQVILDSLFARPGSAPTWGEKKGEFRDWTTFFPLQTFKVGTQEGTIVPTTSRGDTAVFATNSNWFEFLGQNADSELFGTARRTGPCDQSLRANSSGDESQGLVPSCVPTFINSNRCYTAPPYAATREPRFV